METTTPVQRAVTQALLRGLPPLLLFVLLAAGARLAQPAVWEENALLALHRLATPTLDRAALWWSRLFHPQVLVVAALLLTIGFVLRRAWRQASLASGLVVGALVLSTVAKDLVQRPRPRLWPALTGETNPGFPSGHAMTSCAFATLLVILLWPTRWRGVALAVAALWVALVGLARLYLGIHYPTDILAGWCLALAWAAAVWPLTSTPRGTARR